MNYYYNNSNKIMYVFDFEYSEFNDLVGSGKYAEFLYSILGINEVPLLFIGN